MNPRHGSHLAALYADVFAHPADDDLRMVLADALLAAGDPHGELIVAQLDPARDPERRAMRLIQQIGLSILGDLRGAVIPLAYARGFLTSCRVLAVTEEHREVPEWATVEHVELVDDLAVDTDAIAFLTWPALRSLRRVTNARRVHMAVLGGIASMRRVETRSMTYVRMNDGSWLTRLRQEGRDDEPA